MTATNHIQRDFFVTFGIVYIGYTGKGYLTSIPLAKSYQLRSLMSMINVDPDAVILRIVSDGVVIASHLHVYMTIRGSDVSDALFA